MILADLLRRNREWAERRVRDDPDFFTRLTDIQRPEFFWIGCSDSRVPANEIVGFAPGMMFVHRNIANVAAPGDENCMSALQYAVEVLNVRQIIVCGHYGCGGVRAVIDQSPGTPRYAHVDRWLAPLRQLASRHSAELQDLDFDARHARLCELNVIAQVFSVASTDVVKRARLRGVQVNLYGLIYNLGDGLLRDLHVDVAQLQTALTSSS